jgi:hypothetical protein
MEVTAFRRWILSLKAYVEMANSRAAIALFNLTTIKLSGKVKREVVPTFPSFRFPEYKSAHLKLFSTYATQPYRGLNMFARNLSFHRVPVAV